MLDVSILKHPFFYNLDQASATELILDTEAGNFLFCKGDDDNEILLLLKVKKQLGPEFSYDDVEIVTIGCEETGTEFTYDSKKYTSLYAIYKDIPNISQKLTGSPIKAELVPKAAARVAGTTNKDNYPIIPLDIEIVQHYIFPLLDTDTLARSCLVNKTWTALAYNTTMELMERNGEEEQKEILRKTEQVNFIYNVIKEQIASTSALNGNSLSFHDISISNIKILPTRITGELITRDRKKAIIISENSPNIMIVAGYTRGETMSDKEQNTIEELCHHIVDSEYNESSDQQGISLGL